MHWDIHCSIIPRGLLFPSMRQRLWIIAWYIGSLYLWGRNSFHTNSASGGRLLLCTVRRPKAGPKAQNTKTIASVTWCCSLEFILCHMTPSQFLFTSLESIGAQMPIFGRWPILDYSAPSYLYYVISLSLNYYAATLPKGHCLSAHLEQSWATISTTATKKKTLMVVV